MHVSLIINLLQSSRCTSYKVTSLWNITIVLSLNHYLQKKFFLCATSLQVKYVMWQRSFQKNFNGMVIMAFRDQFIIITILLLLYYVLFYAVTATMWSNTCKYTLSTLMVFIMMLIYCLKLHRCNISIEHNYIKWLGKDEGSWTSLLPIRRYF